MIGPEPSTISEGLALDLHTYLIVFGGVLLAYEYVLTLSMEIERFWVSRQVSTTTAFFFVNRYIGLVGYLPILYQFFFVTGEDECRKLQAYGIFYAYIMMASVAALMVIRVYAFYNRDSVVLWALGTHLLFSFVMFVTLRWVGVFRSEIMSMKPPVIPRCVPYRSRKQGKVLAAGWSLKLFFDLMVVFLTIAKSSKFSQTPRPILIDILIADGVLYFVASLALNIFNTCFCILAPPYLRAVCAPLNAVICSVMVTRMTLNLRDPDIIPHQAESLSDRTPESENLVSTILSLGHPSYAESMRSRTDAGSSVIALRRILGSRGAG